MSDSTGLQLEYEDSPRSAATVDEVNAAMAPYGCRVWPLDLSAVPADIRTLLDQKTLSEEEDSRLRNHFFMSRERLLELISEAGRNPQVPGGGEMSTRDATHDIQYPELYLVAPGIDYSRFDKLHRNYAEDGTGVDEILQLVSGAGVRVVQNLPGVGAVTLYLDCLDDQGWIVTYSGKYPHIGSLTGATPGTKLLVQILGPPVWTMNYEA